MEEQFKFTQKDDELKEMPKIPETKFIGNLRFGTNWTESAGRPLEKGESQFFHSTYAYNITHEQYEKLLKEDELILDKRIFFDRVPQLGYDQVPNPEYRKCKDNLFSRWIQ